MSGCVEIRFLSTDISSGIQYLGVWTLCSRYLDSSPGLWVSRQYPGSAVQFQMCIVVSMCPGVGKVAQVSDVRTVPRYTECLIITV